MDSPSTSPVAITCENSAELSLDDKRNNANMVAAMKASGMAANATRKAAKNPKALQSVVNALITATNAFDVAAVLALFAEDGMIDDPSTGHVFIGKRGIQRYIQEYFVGYNTSTRLLTVRKMGTNQVRVRVDFTGDFGHEIGTLLIRIDSDGLIVRVDAALE
nr:nuclear transport factor 2 family protein [Xanthomonas phaseoli]